MIENTKSKRLTLIQWTGLIAGLAAFLGVVVSARAWSDYQAEQPIAEPYRLFLEHIAGISSDAQASLADYRVRYERDTVASRDFAAVCVVMIRDAKAQGASPADYSDKMTRACEQMGRGIKEIP